MKFDNFPNGVRMSLAAARATRLPYFDIPAFQDYRALHSPTDNQGNQPACVGFDVADWLEVQHWVETGRGGKQFPALEIYRRAKVLDGDGQDGTTLDNGVQAAIELGFLPQAAVIRHVRGFRSVAQVLHKQRCCIAAVMVTAYNWETIGANGFIGQADSANLGGHAVPIDSYHVYIKPGGKLSDEATWDMHRSWVGWHNSWGNTWGIGGHARMTLPQFERFFLESVMEK